MHATPTDVTIVDCPRIDVKLFRPPFDLPPYEPTPEEMAELAAEAARVEAEDADYWQQYSPVEEWDPEKEAEDQALTPIHEVQLKDHLYQVYRGYDYQKDRHGLYCLEEVEDKEGNSRLRIQQLTETPAWVEAVVKDIETERRAFKIKYLPGGAKDFSTAVYPTNALLGRYDSDAWQQLIAEGFTITAKQLPMVHAYLAKVDTTGVNARCIPLLDGISRTGWAGMEYTAPGWRTEKAPEFMGSVGRKAGAWVQVGDEAAFLDKYREIMAGNPAVAIIAGYMAAGPLIRFLGSENFILGVIGESSSGKTLAVKLAIACRAHPTSFATFDSTAGSLKNLVQQYRDSSLAIDEIGQAGMKPEDRARLIYDFSQGKERSRLSKNRTNGEYGASLSETVHYTTVVTGELSMLNGVKDAATGQQVRYNEVVFSPENPLWRTITTSDAAEELEGFLAKNHGWLGPRIVENIRDRLDHYQTVHTEMLRGLRVGVAEGPRARKAKLLAVALTGVVLLREALGMPTEIPEELLLARRWLSQAIQVDADRGAEDARFIDALAGITVQQAENLYLQVNDAAVEAPKRKPVLGAAKIRLSQTGKPLEVDIRLISSMAEGWAHEAGIPLSRFLEWAARKGLLKIHKGNKQADGTYKERRTLGLAVGPTTLSCYQFLLRGDVLDTLRAELDPNRDQAEANASGWPEYIDVLRECYPSQFQDLQAAEELPEGWQGAFAQLCRDIDHADAKKTFRWHEIRDGVGVPELRHNQGGGAKYKALLGRVFSGACRGCGKRAEPLDDMESGYCQRCEAAG